MVMPLALRDESSEEGVEVEQQHPTPASSLDPGGRLMQDAAIFGWHGSDVVLLLEQQAERWIVARSWRSSDSLRHVRRWSFDTPDRAAGQIRRLVREAGGDHVAAGAAALAWLSTEHAREQSPAPELS